MKRDVWTLTYKKLKIQRYINRQCIDVGLCINWNYKPSIEISFFFWRIDIEVDINPRRVIKKWREGNVTRIN